jgi:CHAD domain-containing protein
VPDFALSQAETLSAALRRISIEQFETALSLLSSSNTPRDVAVHEMRKAAKRVRSLLRMVRPGIGERVFQAENAVLRDAARQLAGVRDGAVMVDAVRRLRGRYGHLLAPGLFGELEDRLVVRHERMSSRVLRDEEALENVVGVLYRARSRYAAWPVEFGASSDLERSSLARLGAKAITHSFRSIGPGIALTYRQGQRQMREAQALPTAERFHAWRKRVKYLRHQMEIITPVWPEVLGGLANSLEHLGDVLGDEHDQAQLIGLVASLPEMVADPDERNLLIALSQQRRRELQGAAMVMGRRIYAETPERFAGRLGAYWAAWSLEGA